MADIRFKAFCDGENSIRSLSLSGGFDKKRKGGETYLRPSKI